MKLSKRPITSDRVLHALPAIFAVLTLCAVYVRFDYPESTGRLGIYMGIAGLIGLFVTIIANIVITPTKQAYAPSHKKVHIHVGLLIVSLILFGLEVAYAKSNGCGEQSSILYPLGISGSLFFAASVAARLNMRSVPANISIRAILSLMGGLAAGALAFYIVGFATFAVVGLCFSF